MDDSRQLRDCLGRFATGVTVVTCRDASGRPCGITANSFSSVSLEPPLVSWNIARSSNSLEAFVDAEHFAIHVLSGEQLAESVHFARTDHTRFEGIEFADSSHGVPILAGCLAVIECSSNAVHEAGDHYIIVGHVDRYVWADADPLLFYGGRYRRLANEDS
jgi:3-hydroxy-9,10-secoandrosta-1,3,5(10)-triene-9,17-dione monooxygenase reductase component